MTKLAFNPTALALAADTARTAALGQVGVPTANINSAIADAEAKLKADAQQELAETLIQVYTFADSQLSNNISIAQSLEKQIAVYNSLNAEILRAKAYASATGNAIPLMILVGHANFVPASISEELKKMPKDWVAPAAAAPVVDDLGTVAQ